MTNVDSVSSTKSESPFLAARENPLCVELVTRVKFRFANQDWPWHLNQLREMNYRAAIVGPHGSGKTTLLFELLEQFRRFGFQCHHVFLPQDRDSHPDLLSQAIEKSRTGSILLIDGIERLRLHQRWNLFRITKTGPGLIVNLHRTCRFPARLPTWIQTTTGLELMSQILNDLDLDVPEIQSAGAAAFDNSNGNIRDALRDLYDQFASGRFNRTLSR